MLNVKRLSGLMNGGQHLQSDPAVGVSSVHFGLSLKPLVLFCFEENLLTSICQMFWLKKQEQNPVWLVQISNKPIQSFRLN